MKPILLIILLLTSLKLQAQMDPYDQLKEQYDSLRKEKKYEEVLKIAKQMNAWALENESDTSLRYAVSFRYIGNSFINNMDSSIFYFQRSLGVLIEQDRPFVLDVAHCYNNIGILFDKIGEYENAIINFNKSLGIKKKILSLDDPDLINTQMMLGEINKKEGNYKQAELFFLQVLESRMRVFGDNNHNIIPSLMTLGGIYWEMGDYKPAIQYYNKALEILKHTLGQDHLDYIAVLDQMQNAYYAVGEYTSAESLYRQSLEIIQKKRGQNHLAYARCLDNCGFVHWKLANFEQSEDFFKQSLEVKKKLLGEEHQDYITSLNGLGSLYSDMGDYKSAELLFKKCLQVRNKVLGKYHIDIARSLNNLAAVYKAMANYDKAAILYKKSLEVYEKTSGDNNLDYSNALQNLGNLYLKIGDYKIAENYYKKSLEIKKKTVGEEHPEYAGCLYSFGNLYFTKGDFKSAESFFKQSLEINKKKYGEDHPNCADDINALGVVYQRAGDYKSAESFYKKSLMINMKAFGEHHIRLSGSMENLGLLYKNMGNYKAAESLYKRSLEITKKVYGDEHPDYAKCLNDLGVMYSHMGNYKDALTFYEQSMKIKKIYFGADHYVVAKSLISLGDFYHKTGDYESAEAFFKQTLDIYKQTVGEEHPDYANGLNCLAALYFEVGNYKSAEALFKRSLEINKRVLGEDHNSIESRLHNLVLLYARISDFEAAIPYLKLNFAIKNKRLGTNLLWLSSYEKEVYWAQENDFYSSLNTFASKALIEVPSSTELSYNGNLVSKSLLLETSRELDQALAASSDTTLKENYQNLKSLRKNYSKLLSEGSDNKVLMERLNREADSLDKILVNSLGEYAASKRKFEITWKDVQSNLNSTEAAIEFAKYYDDKDSVYKYMALVVRPDYEYPKLALLGEEEQIREYIESRTFEALYPMVWEPIEKHLSGVERVYYSPSGQLNNLSFSALCMGERRELSQQEKDDMMARGEPLDESTSSFECEYLMDRYELHQLTTTRYIADGTLDKQTTMNTSIALGGGINYDTVPIAYSENKEEDNTEYIFAMNLQQEQEKAKENTKRSSKNTSSMKYLEGTKKEVDQVAALFQNKNWSLSAYTDTKAEEGKFKEEVEKNKAGIIHIATHGFAFPDVKKNKRQQQLIGTEEISYKASEDPMVRCGLMFSGSNVSWTGNPQKMIKETGEDGILTAAEVSNMDLSNTKLVVLSACETGLGKIEGSEGTFGLKRGFKLSGVEQMIVSLWSVPDKETMELMTLFYEDLTESLNPVISFEKAQKQMRESYPTRPDLWAGFVLVR